MGRRFFGLTVLGDWEYRRVRGNESHVGGRVQFWFQKTRIYQTDRDQDESLFG